MDLHETLELLRSRRGISVREMAQRLSLNPSTLARWLNGENVPPWDKAVRIAEFLGARVTIGEPGTPGGSGVLDAVRPLDEQAVVEVFRGSGISRADAIEALLAKSREVYRRQPNDGPSPGRKASE